MKFLRRLQYFFHARCFEEELAEEMRIHREMAGRNFGSTALALEDSRAVWRFGRLDSLLRDIRYALRGFRRSPGFTFTVIGTLALGLGVLAASFSVFNAMVLQPFSVRDPYSLYGLVGWGQSWALALGHRASYSWSIFKDIRRENPAFSEILGYQSGNALVDKKSASVQAVTGNYFTMLGGRICMGRALLESDDESGQGVGVASYAAWKSRFGADPRIVGRVVRLGEKSVDIVGVACPEFNGAQKQPVDLWVSLAVSRELADPDRTVEFREGPNRTLVSTPVEFPQLMIIGRLKPGLTPASAEASLLAYGKQAYRSWPRSRKAPEAVRIEQQATSFPLNSQTIGLFMPTFIAFGLVLLIACANVSNMMLARGLARQREIGIRISLGAGRARMVRQLLTESMLLAIPAALVAFGVSYGIIRGGRWLQTTILPASGVGRVFGLAKNIGANVDLTGSVPGLGVFAFLLAAALITTLVFGLVPAIETTRSRLVQANRGEFESGCRPARLRCLLVIAQTTMCALLLILAGVAMRNEMRLASQDLGLNIDGVFTISTSTKVSGQVVLERLSSLPGFESAGMCSKPPLDTSSHWIDALGKWTGENGIVELRTGGGMVSPEYFDVYGIPVRRSEIKDMGDGHAVIVSETFARRLWPSGNALGQVTRHEVPVGKTGRTMAMDIRVVGVARDSVHQLYDWTGAPNPNRILIYQVIPLTKWLSMQNGPVSERPAPIVVRMKGSPGAARLHLQKAMEDITPGDTHFKIVSAREHLDRFLYPYRALAAIAVFLGVLSFLLTASGVFGMLSYVVTQRRKEFGIRIALGAGKARVTGMVLRQSLLLAAGGAALGSLGALYAARVMSSYVYEIDLFDAGGYAMGLVLVIVAALVASWIPVRKATNLDPARTLHCD